VLPLSLIYRKLCVSLCLTVSLRALCGDQVKNPLREFVWGAEAGKDAHRASAVVASGLDFQCALCMHTCKHAHVNAHLFNYIRSRASTNTHSFHCIRSRAHPKTCPGLEEKTGAGVRGRGEAGVSAHEAEAEKEVDDSGVLQVLEFD